MLRTQASDVCGVLLSVFASWGHLPHTIFSDNGPPFNSDEYRRFLAQYNIVMMLESWHSGALRTA